MVSRRKSREMMTSPGWNVVFRCCNIFNWRPGTWAKSYPPVNYGQTKKLPTRCHLWMKKKHFFKESVVVFMSIEPFGYRKKIVMLREILYPMLLVYRKWHDIIWNIHDNAIIHFDRILSELSMANKETLLFREKTY